MVFQKGLLHPSIPLTSVQRAADQLVSSFVEKATDGYSVAAAVGGGLAYRLGRVGTLAIGSRFVGAYGRTPLHLLIRPASIAAAFTGEVFTFEAVQRALRVGIGGDDDALLRWSGENGLGRGMVETAVVLGPLHGAAVLARGQNPVLQHLFQDGAMVLAHNVYDRLFTGRGTLQRAPTIAEQFVNAEATLWQVNAGMSLVHGAFPGLGQGERGLNLEVRSQIVGVAPRGHPISGTHGEVPLHLSDPLLATAGGNGFRTQDPGRSAAEQLYSQMAAMGEGGPPRQPPPIPKDRVITFQNFAAVPRPVDTVLHELRKTAPGKTLTVVLGEFLPHHFREMGERLFRELNDKAPEFSGRTLIFRSPLIHNFPFQNKRASLPASDVRFEFHYEINNGVRWTFHNAPK